MHKHDPDLIAAFAEGSLDADQAQHAEALIASCNDCRSELEAQRVALATLAGAPRPQMTGAERSELHRAINREATPATGTPWYVRLAPALSAAAVLVLVVGVAGVMLRGSSTGDEAALAPPAEVAEPATSAAAATEERAALPTEPSGSSLDLAVDPVQDLGKMSTEALETFLADAGIDRLQAATQAPAAVSEDAARGSFLVPRTCASEAQARNQAAEVAIAAYTAEVDETPVEIYVFEDGAAVVLETPECAVFFETPAP